MRTKKTFLIMALVPCLPFAGQANAKPAEPSTRRVVSEEKPDLIIADDEAQKHTDAGFEAIRKEDYKLAENEFKQAIAVSPEFSPARSGLGYAYYLQDRNEEAKREYDKAIELDPTDPYPHDNLGDVYYEEDKYDEAER